MRTENCSFASGATPLATRYEHNESNSHAGDDSIHSHFTRRAVVEKLLLFTAHVGSPSDSVVEEWRGQRS